MERTGNLNESLIQCKGLSKSFYSKNKTNEVLRNITLDVNKNEFVVLFGPAQCGRTTMINLMAGLETPTEGSVVVDGQKITAPGPERGVVYQKTALFPWLTVLGNVEYGPKMCGVPKAERRKIAQKYIDLVGLTGFENSFPTKLSGGMRQRVGIARAYANNPLVLLMDEPFGHLDAQTRYMMEEELNRVWLEEKRTVVFVTNNIEEAIYLADRIILLTNSPTTIQKEYVIDIPRPRDYVSPEFLALRKEITDAMESSF